MTLPESREELALKELNRQRAQKPSVRQQSEIVQDNTALIRKLIRDQRASKKEVAEVLLGLGEPVLEKGFLAELLKQIGTVKEIRNGGPKPGPGPELPAPPPSASPTSDTNSNFVDDEDGFAIRPTLD